MLFLLNVVLALCFLRAQGQDAASDADVGQGGRPGWAGYAALGGADGPGLRGWLRLERAPAAPRAAAAACLLEDAVLASPWSAAWRGALGAAAARAGLPALLTGARALLPPLPGAEDSAELVRCGTVRADGSEGHVPCDARLPYACYADDPTPERLRRAGYQHHAALRGWLRLHGAPRAPRAARLACRLEGAFLWSPWTPEFTAAARALAARAQAPAVLAGVVRTETYADAAYTNVNGTSVLSLEPGALVRRVTCRALRPDGSESDVSCAEPLPFICFAPESAEPGAARPLDPADPAPVAASPSPLPLSPTSELITFRTLRTIPTTLPGPLTNPTTSSPIPTTTAAPPTTPVPAPTTAPPTTPVPTPTTARTTTTLPPPTTAVPAPVPTSSPAPSTTPSAEDPPTTPPPFNVCEEMGLAGYRWEEVTEQCYRFHATGATWPAANATCAAEGAALAVAGSDEEASLFTRLLLDNLRTGISGASFKGAVALGFYWEPSDQRWRTNDGTPLEETGYSKWWPGWPRAESVARWGFMEHTGRLENYSDTITTPYICEAPR